MNQKASRDGDHSLNVEELTILAIEALEREVNNGGYGQFFVNTPEFSPVIVDALRRIGCPKTADITQRAVGIVERIPITIEESENGTWSDNEERSDEHCKCDTMYFKDPENIEQSLFAFIKVNRSRIRP